MAVKIPSELRVLCASAVNILPRRDSPHTTSAIHDHRLAGDERGGLAGQKYGSSNQIFRLPDSPQRDFLSLGVNLLLALMSTWLRRIGDARANDINGDPTRR